MNVFIKRKRDVKTKKKHTQNDCEKETFYVTFIKIFQFSILYTT